EFGLATKAAALSFVATFGVVKALTNLLAGRLGDRYGRKRVLVAGWLCALPVPVMIIWAPTWGWIVAANVLLGINQGLAWSMAVIMKIDLVGPRQRGLAMGLNEFAGYLAVALSALATGGLASRYGLRPEPFYLGIAVAAAGLALSVLFVRDTTAQRLADAAVERLQHDLAAVRKLRPFGVRHLSDEPAWRGEAVWARRPAGEADRMGAPNRLDTLADGPSPAFMRRVR
ncbi:MAG: MFS transporter, partial [Gemmatirosa sp.]